MPWTYSRCAPGLLLVAIFLASGPALRLLPPAATLARLRPMIGFGSGYSLTQLGNWGAQNALESSSTKRCSTTTDKSKRHVWAVDDQMTALPMGTASRIERPGRSSSAQL